MSRQFDHLADVEVFLNVVEHQSISAAAIKLSTTASVVSRAITRLEKHLGIQLLRRTTRRLSLTEEGRQYVEQMQIAFGLIGDTERKIQGGQANIHGVIKISVPTTYGHYRIAQLLKGFQFKYPNIQITLNISNRNVDLTAEGFDFAIRQGQLPDSGLVGRRLENAVLRLVASPAYLNTTAIPQIIEDLKSHRCIVFELPSSGKISPWLFKQENENIDLIPQTNLLVKEDILGVVSLAEQGLGICQTYGFIVDDKIKQGRLISLLDNFSGRTRPFSLIYSPHRQMSAAARAFIDYLSIVNCFN